MCVKKRILKLHDRLILPSHSMQGLQKLLQAAGWSLRHLYLHNWSRALTMKKLTFYLNGSMKAGTRLQLDFKW